MRYKNVIKTLIQKFKLQTVDISSIFQNATKARVTNPTATGRFLVAGGFTGLPLIFPHRTGDVQN
jgi:hypothetical protein